MTKNRRIVSAGITHAAALLIGWGGWTAFRHFSAEDMNSATATRNAREPRGSPTKSVDEILSAFAAKAKESPESQATDWPRMDDRLRDEFAQASVTISISGDFEAVLAAEMAKMKEGETPSMKMGAIMYAWALADPLALMDWRGYEDGARGKVLYFYEDEIFRKLIAQRGLASLAPVLKHLPGGDFTTRTVARILAKSADVAALRDLKQMSAGQWKRVRSEEIGELWPWPERAKLVTLAVSEGDVGMIAKLATSTAANPSGAGVWLLQLLQDESLDPGFRENLAKDDVLKEIARKDRTLPLSDRVALMDGGNPDAVAGGKEFDEFVWRDIAAIVDHERDWNYDFRHGAIEATEVLAQISKELPELAAKSPDTLRKWVFRNLIEEDPPRAMRLLDPSPPDVRAKTVLDTAKRQFYQSDPNLLLAALQQVPADDPVLRGDRLGVWIRKTVYNYQDHDAAYVEWVRALPAGIDRELALHALAQAADEENPPLAGELRAEMEPETREPTFSQ